MTKEELFEFSSTQKKVADKVISETKIIDLLKKYGKPYFVGSYKYDLMFSGDIDIHVILEKLDREIAKNIYLEIMNSEQFSSTQFTDFYSRKYDNPSHRDKKGFPKGFYIGIRHFFTKNENWKIDIWLLETDKKDKYAEPLYHITDKQKYEILKLKEKRKLKKINLTSTDIYTKVLNQ